MRLGFYHFIAVISVIALIAVFTASAVNVNYVTTSFAAQTTGSVLTSSLFDTGTRTVGLDPYSATRFGTTYGESTNVGTVIKGNGTNVYASDMGMFQSTRAGEATTIDSTREISSTGVTISEERGATWVLGNFPMNNTMLADTGGSGCQGDCEVGTAGNYITSASGLKAATNMSVLTSGIDKIPVQWDETVNAPIQLQNLVAAQGDGSLSQWGRITSISGPLNSTPITGVEKTTVSQRNFVTGKYAVDAKFQWAKVVRPPQQLAPVVTPMPCAAALGSAWK